MVHAEVGPTEARPRNYFYALRCFAELMLPHLRNSYAIDEGFSQEIDSTGATLRMLPKGDDTSLADTYALGALSFCQTLHPRKPTVCQHPNDSLTRLSVMSYNVFFHPRQGQDREQRRRHLIEALKGFEKKYGRPLPDVVAFQEVDDAFVEHEGLKALYPYRTQRRLMNMIASKYPIVEFRHFDQQPGNMMVTLDVSGKRGCDPKKHIHLVNVHLHAGNFESGQEQRLKEYAELREWIASMDLSPHEPVIIAGDFNDETGDLAHMHDWIVKYDHSTTGKFVDGKYRLGSWSSRANWLVALHFQSRYRYYPRGYTKTIDYVAYDRRFLAPVEASEMRVLLLKSPVPWEYKCEGPSPWCDSEAMWHLRGKWEASTWFDGHAGGRLYHGELEKGDDLYDELSDHFPVLQDYAFCLG